MVSWFLAPSPDSLFQPFNDHSLAHSTQGAGVVHHIVLDGFRGQGREVDRFMRRSRAGPGALRLATSCDSNLQTGARIIATSSDWTQILLLRDHAGLESRLAKEEKWVPVTVNNWFACQR